MHQKSQHTVLPNHTQSDKAFPGFQSHVICITKLRVLRESRRLKRHDSIHDKLQRALKSRSRIDVLEGWNPLIQSLMTGELFDGFLCKLELFGLYTKVKVSHNTRWHADKTLS